MTERSRGMPREARAWLAALLLGLGLGAASLLGDAVGVRLLNGLANAAAPWLVVAFACGLLQRSPGPGAAAGVAGLVVGVLVYYLGVPVVFGAERAYAGPLIAMWVAGSVVGGAVFGAAGGVWATGTGRRRAVAGALPAAALFGEAAHRLVQIEPWTGIDFLGTYAQVMVAEAIAGIIALWLINRDSSDRVGYAAAAALAIATLASLLAVEAASRALAFG